LRDVRLHSPAACLGSNLLRLLGFGAIADHDRRASARKLEGDGGADASRGARDERRLALQRGERLRQV
jgi:hypothetical protein